MAREPAYTAELHEDRLRSADAGVPHYLGDTAGKFRRIPRAEFILGKATDLLGARALRT